MVFCDQGEQSPGTPRTGLQALGALVHAVGRVGLGWARGRERGTDPAN